MSRKKGQVKALLVGSKYGCVQKNQLPEYFGSTLKVFVGGARHCVGWVVLVITFSLSTRGEIE